MKSKREELRNAMIDILQLMLRLRRMAITAEQMRDCAMAQRMQTAQYHQGMADLCAMSVVELDKLQGLIAGLAEAAPIPQSNPPHSYAMAEFQATVQSVFSQRGARC